MKRFLETVTNPMLIIILFLLSIPFVMAYEVSMPERVLDNPASITCIIHDNGTWTCN